MHSLFSLFAGSALRFAVQKAISPSSGGRAGVAKAVVMLVMDKSTDDVREAANEALAAGTQIIVRHKTFDASVKSSVRVSTQMSQLWCSFTDDTLFVQVCQCSRLGSDQTTTRVSLVCLVTRATKITLST